MKDLDYRMIFLFAFPLTFAVLYLLFSLNFSPPVSTDLAVTFNNPFFPFMLMAILLLLEFPRQGYIIGFILFALLCVVVQYYYMRVLRQRQKWRGIPLVVATYLFTGLLMTMVILFPLIGTEETDMPHLYLQKVDQNE